MGKPCVLKCYVYPKFPTARWNAQAVGEGKQIDFFSNGKAR